MARISVPFVDDEEAIRATFEARFEDQFDITLASDGTVGTTPVESD